MSEVLLEVDRVSKRFGGVVALDSISFDVKAGETVGLLGPNGAGKTTLFEIVSGHLKPTSGSVRFKGVDITSKRVDKRARMGIGRTFQRMELFEGLNFYEHVTLAMRAKAKNPNPLRDLIDGGRFRREELERAEELRELVGLSLEEAKRPVESLSLGHGRLVELARALALNPDLLLLDEPSSGLSTPETRRFIGTLREVLSSRGVSAVLVEHDVNVVFSMASRVVAISAGRVIAEGTPEEVRSSEEVRKAYFGS